MIFYSDGFFLLKSPLFGAWHHLACVDDGTTRRIYIDGSLVDADTPPGDEEEP